MFRIGQIISSTRLVRHFRRVARYLESHPQPLLVLQKSGPALVLVNAEIFEELVGAKLHSDGVEVSGDDINDIIGARF